MNSPVRKTSASFVKMPVRIRAYDTKQVRKNPYMAMSPNGMSGSQPRITRICRTATTQKDPAVAPYRTTPVVTTARLSKWTPARLSTAPQIAANPRGTAVQNSFRLE